MRHASIMLAGLIAFHASSAAIGQISAIDRAPRAADDSVAAQCDPVRPTDPSAGGFLDRAGRPIGTRGEPINYPPSERDNGAGVDDGPSRGGSGECDGDSGPEGGIASVTPNTAVREWLRAGFGSGIGATGMYVADIDGDGQSEIVAAASVSGFAQNTFWYVAAFDNQGYKINYISGPIDGGIRALRLVDANGDGASDVLVATPTSMLLFDGVSKALIRSFPVNSTGPRGVRVADVDHDGQLEVIFCDDAATAVYDLTFGQLEWRSTSYPGNDLDVGNVDQDPDLEIVISNGTVLNGQTHAVEWQISGGLGTMVRVGDIDGDGMDEIVCVVSSQVRIYDADTQTLRSYRPSFSPSPPALALADTDGDGIKEILTANSQWGNVYVLDGTTNGTRWSFSNPDHGVTELAVGDPDHDGQRELLYGAGFSSTGPDHLYVLDVATHVSEWVSFDVSGPYYGMASANINFYGAPELLLTCYESRAGYDDGWFFIHDGATYAEQLASTPANANGANSMWRIAAGNLDSDRNLEYVVTASRGYTGLLVCYDGVTHEEQWRTSGSSSLGFRSLQIADVDGDERLDVCAAVYRETTGATGTYVYVFDGASGAEVWRSPSIGTYWAALNFLRVGNVDADPNPEIVVAEAGAAVYVFDGVTHELQFASADLDVSALELVDLDGNAVREIVVGTTTGSIVVLNRDTGAVAQTLLGVGAAVDGLQFGNFYGGPALEVAYCAGGRLFIRRAAANSPLIWSSGVLGVGAGANDSLLAADVDGDLRTELVVNAGTSVQVFELRRSNAGDMNCDGLINGFDIDPFVLAIVEPQLYAAQFPNCDTLRGDIDGNGRFDNFDIDPFVGLLVD